MYIGKSITKNKSFNNLYLYNLRLWQLQITSEMKNIAFYERKNMKNDLRVASLILVHSNSKAIKFRMDEKQFLHFFPRDFLLHLYNQYHETKQQFLNFQQTLFPL